MNRRAQWAHQLSRDIRSHQRDIRKVLAAVHRDCGYAPSEIATILGYSTPTIQTYLDEGHAEPHMYKSYMVAVDSLSKRARVNSRSALAYVLEFQKMSPADIDNLEEYIDYKKKKNTFGEGVLERAVLYARQLRAPEYRLKQEWAAFGLNLLLGAGYILYLNRPIKFAFASIVSMPLLLAVIFVDPPWLNLSAQLVLLGALLAIAYDGSSEVLRHNEQALKLRKSLLNQRT